MSDVELLSEVLKLVDATTQLIASIQRSLIIQSAMIALIGMATGFNFWMLRRTLRLMREVIKLMKELTDEHTR